MSREHVIDAEIIEETIVPVDDRPRRVDVRTTRAPSVAEPRTAERPILPRVARLVLQVLRDHAEDEIRPFLPR